MGASYIIHSNVSCGQRYNRPEYSESENRLAYGDLYSPEGLGHNLRFEVQLTDSERMKTPQELQKLVVESLKELDHSFLNEDVFEFKEKTPSPEALAAYILQKLTTLIGDQCQRVRVYEGSALWGECSYVDGYRLAKQYILNCIHRHHNPELSDQENADLYGQCSRLHGHEYKVEVQLTPVDGDLLQPWNVVIKRQELDDIVFQNLISKFDKKYLNDWVGNTSGEIICRKFFDVLQPKFKDLYKLQLRLCETRKNSFFYSE